MTIRGQANIGNRLRGLEFQAEDQCELPSAASDPAIGLPSAGPRTHAPGSLPSAASGPAISLPSARPQRHALRSFSTTASPAAKDLPSAASDLAIGLPSAGPRLHVPRSASTAVLTAPGFKFPISSPIETRKRLAAEDQRELPLAASDLVIGLPSARPWAHVPCSASTAAPTTALGFKFPISSPIETRKRLAAEGQRELPSATSGSDPAIGLPSAGPWVHAPRSAFTAARLAGGSLPSAASGPAIGLPSAGSWPHAPRSTSTTARLAARSLPSAASGLAISLPSARAQKHALHSFSTTVSPGAKDLLPSAASDLAIGLPSAGPQLHAPRSASTAASTALLVGFPISSPIETRKRLRLAAEDQPDLPSVALGPAINLPFARPQMHAPSDKTENFGTEIHSICSSKHMPKVPNRAGAIESDLYVAENSIVMSDAAHWQDSELESDLEPEPEAELELDPEPEPEPELESDPETQAPGAVGYGGNRNYSAGDGTPAARHRDWQFDLDNDEQLCAFGAKFNYGTLAVLSPREILSIALYQVKTRKNVPLETHLEYLEIISALTKDQNMDIRTVETLLKLLTGIYHERFDVCRNGCVCFASPELQKMTECPECSLSRHDQYGRLHPYSGWHVSVANFTSHLLRAYIQVYR